MPNGTQHVIVCKAYALANFIAKKRYPGFIDIHLACSRSADDGEVVVVEDDRTERLG